jgi:hypothetical protein
MLQAQARDVLHEGRKAARLGFLLGRVDNRSLYKKRKRCEMIVFFKRGLHARLSRQQSWFSEWLGLPVGDGIYY